MEQLKDQTSTQSNNLKLMGLLDDMRAKNDLLSEGILFIYAIYPQPIKPTTHLFLNNDNYGATENTQISPWVTKLTY